MGAVLSFEPRGAVRKSAKPLPEGAAIIIFPGVRYERTAATERAVIPAAPAAGALGDKGPAKH